jgi:hypothetical protein
MSEVQDAKVVLQFGGVMARTLEPFALWLMFASSVSEVEEVS